MSRLRPLLVLLLACLVPLLVHCAPVTVPAGPAVTVPKLEASRIVAADGAVLPLRHWPRAVAACRLPTDCVPLLRGGCRRFGARTARAPAYRRQRTVVF